MAEFNCVVDKVVNNLSDFAFIGFDGTGFRGKGQLELNPLLFTRSLKGFNLLLDNLIDIKYGQLMPHGFGVYFIMR